MRLAADANVLLSAVLGGRAKLVLDHPQVSEIFTAAVTLAEVEEYAAELARRKRLRLDVVLMAVATLPVTVVDSPAYEDSVAEARRRIGRRDPDDVGKTIARHRIPLCGQRIWGNPMLRV